MGRYDAGSPEKVTFPRSADGLEDWYYVCNAGRGTDCLVYLHGHGSTGDQLFTRADVKVRLPLIGRLNLSIIAPNLRGNAWMCPAAVADLRRILTDCRERFGFRRFLFVSGSMGGTGALIFAVRCPELADAVGVMGGVTKLRRYLEFLRGGALPVHQQILEAIETHYRAEDYALHDVSDQAAKLVQPLYFAHGEADAVMPVTEMFDLRDKLGGRPDTRFRSIPGGDHDSPLALFGEMLEFLPDRLG